jgi:hypothetical protein
MLFAISGFLLEKRKNEQRWKRIGRMKRICHGFCRFSRTKPRRIQRQIGRQSTLCFFKKPQRQTTGRVDVRYPITSCGRLTQSVPDPRDPSDPFPTL